MKKLTLPLVIFSVVLTLGNPLCRADAGIQKDTPGAAGTSTNNPAHQDSDTTGPNGEHHDQGASTNAAPQ